MCLFALHRHYLLLKLLYQQVLLPECLREPSFLQLKRAHFLRLPFDFVHALQLLLVGRLLLEGESLGLRGEDSKLGTQVLLLTLVLDELVGRGKLQKIAVFSQVRGLAEEVSAATLGLVEVTAKLADQVSVTTVLCLGQKGLIL